MAFLPLIERLGLKRCNMFFNILYSIYIYNNKIKDYDVDWHKCCHALIFRNKDIKYIFF